MRKSLAWSTSTKTNNPYHWAKFKALSDSFGRELRKCDHSVEKKVVESKKNAAFYKFLKPRLNVKPKLGPIRREHGTSVISDLEKAEASLVCLKNHSRLMTAHRT